MKVQRFIAKTLNATIACAALWLVQVASAEENVSAFDEANQAFVQGRPVEAARTLEGIIGKQGYSSAVLFNLANAQLRAGNTGQAILNYERAHLLAPADPDIAANLRLVSEHIQARPAKGQMLHWTDWFTVNVWAVFGTASLLLLAATLPLGLLLSARRRTLSFTRIVAGMVLLSSLTALGIRWGELNRAVVTAKAADARISPVTVGPPLFILPEGTTVSIVKSHGAFTLVCAQNGQRGWIKRDTIEPIIRRTS